MFQVTKYTHDAVTGGIDVAAFFQIKNDGNIVEIKKTFFSDTSAKNWLRKEMTGYFLAKLENYIIHKKNIIENPPFRHKSMLPKEQALKECLRFLAYAVEKQDLREACHWAVQMFSKLQTILPNEKNASYETSKKQLN